MSPVEWDATFKESEEDEEIIGYEIMEEFVGNWVETYSPPMGLIIEFYWISVTHNFKNSFSYTFWFQGKVALIICLAGLLYVYFLPMSLLFKSKFIRLVYKIIL